MAAPKTTLWQDLLAALKGFPGYLVAFVGGFVVYILSDIEITSLFLAAVFVGLATGSVAWGFGAFYIGFSFFKAIGKLGDAVVFGQRIRASAVTTPPPPSED